MASRAPSAALRSRSVSTTKEPRNPLPPVTITRLSCQKVALSGQAGGIGSMVDMAGRIRELLELQKPNEDSL